MSRRKRSRDRFDVTIWYPHAHDLKLLHVPDEARAHIRKRLAPWLRTLTHAISITDPRANLIRLGVEPGHCWEVAQGLVMTAHDPGVKYVEGVWTRLPGNELFDYKDDHRPEPHAWATVDGHHVDLVGELYGWRGVGDDVWGYEPLKEYSYDDLWALFGNSGECISPEGFDISSYFWWRDVGTEEDWPDHLKSQKQPRLNTCVAEPSREYPNGLWGTPEEREALDRFWEERASYETSIVFKPAIDRLIKRVDHVGKPARVANEEAA